MNLPNEPKTVPCGGMGYPPYYKIGEPPEKGDIIVTPYSTTYPWGDHPIWYIRWNKPAHKSHMHRKDQVRLLLSWANDHPEKTFFVSALGWDAAEVAPHFVLAPSNFRFPITWKPYMTDTRV